MKKLLKNILKNLNDGLVYSSIDFADAMFLNSINKYDR